MPRSLLTPVLRWLHIKDDERCLISAAFHMITITLITMSMVNVTWFSIIAPGVTIPDLTLGQFFWFGYTDADIDYSEYEFINSTIVNMMRTTILLCFMAIIFSLSGFFFDIIGPRSILYRIFKRYALPGICTVLWIMGIVSVSYYSIFLLEESLGKLYPKLDTTVYYGFGFYLLAGAGGVTLLGISYNIISSHHTNGGNYRDDDDRCLIDESDDGLDTFNSPTPPPPYNVPPPPYTP